jgi:DNA-binding response OmpR family regulator
VPAREVVRVTVHRLRRKIGDSGPERRFIQTIPGVGLKLRVPTEADERRSAL